MNTNKILAFAVLVLALGASWAWGARKDESMLSHGYAVPPIDRDAPAVVKTATFAMG